MPNPEWGTKRICPTTGKRFYDLNKTPIISPYSGEIVDIESARPERMAAANAAQRHPPPAPRAMFFQRFDGVGGTGRIIAARPTEDGREGDLVAAHEQDEELPYHARFTRPA